jgi:DNA-binding PadR family transcriptional regulator
MAQLYVVKSADFLFLQNQTGMTPGNLSAHLSKLQAANYVEVIKEVIERKPHTALALTQMGREAFKLYLNQVRQFVDKIPEPQK